MSAQSMTFAWVRESGDPSQFGFQKLPSDGPPSDTFVVEEADRQSGKATLAFTHLRPYSVVAIDLDSNPRTFFTAPEPVFATSPTGTSSGSDLRSITPTSSTPNSNIQPGSTETSRSESTYETESLQPTSTATPQKSKNRIPVVVGSTVGGVLGFSVLLLLITCPRRRRFRVRFPPSFNIPEFERYQQNLIHTPLTSSMAQRQLLGDTGRSYTAETSSQSVAPVLQEQLKVPVPELATLQSQDHAEENEHLQVISPQEGGSGRISVDEAVERAVQGLRSQFAAVTRRIAQLESELAEPAPPDYTSNPSDPPIQLDSPIDCE
ncbi:hypothetical protein PM082_018622 [Marasmius tenuissimus]|nr:hypothetical protein PM082_018622 [Marasmius tenuissimus]